MIYGKCKIRLGLLAGKVYQGRTSEIRDHLERRGWFFWSPEDVRERVKALEAKNYEHDPVIVTAKILLR